MGKKCTYTIEQKFGKSFRADQDVEKEKKNNISKGDHIAREELRTKLRKSKRRNPDRLQCKKAKSTG